MAGHQGDVSAGGQVREQPAVLDDVPDPQPDGPGGGRRDRLAVERDRAGVRLDQPDEQPQEGGLAAPAGADQHGRPPGRHLERQRAEGRPPGVHLRDAAQREHQAVTVTPFQNATYPAICFAASFGSG